MISKNISSLLFCFFLLSCAPQDSEIEIPKTSQVENLIEHSKEFERKVYSYDTPGGKIHVAIGFGIANSIMVEGDSGNIIIDSSDSTYEAEEIYKLFKQKNSNPIKAIIYTHNHGDHTFGTAYYLTQKERPKIIAHKSTDYYMQRILGIINPIISTRSTRMFGTALPEDDVINVGIGKSLNISKSPFGYVSPDTTFEDELKINIAGINIELYHAPGETNDQLFVWLPNHKSLMPGDNIYKTFPNLYTIRGTTHRDVMGWVSSLDHMRSFNSEYVFPSHTKPIIGSVVISDTLTLYRDAIQFVHDQTVRLMNQGFYPDQIIQLVELPEPIKKSPFLNEFYGTVRWSVKSIFNGYLGWFNGNPAELDPLSRKDEAQKFANLAGGEEALFLAFQNAVNDKEMQWALELSDRLMALNYSIAEVESLRREALLYIGARSSNPNKRNYFLSSALELNDNFVSFSETERTVEGVKEISIDTIFSILSVRLNPEKVVNKNMNVCFYFSSGLRKTISIRNQVAAISNQINDPCAIKVKSTEFNFKMAISGLANPVIAMANGDLEVDGSNTEFLQFLTYFR